MLNFIQEITTSLELVTFTQNSIPNRCCVGTTHTIGEAQGYTTTNILVDNFLCYSKV